MWSQLKDTYLISLINKIMTESEKNGGKVPFWALPVPSINLWQYTLAVEKESGSIEPLGANL